MGACTLRDTAPRGRPMQCHWAFGQSRSPPTTPKSPHARSCTLVWRQDDEDPRSWGCQSAKRSDPPAQRDGRGGSVAEATSPGFWGSRGSRSSESLLRPDGSHKMRNCGPTDSRHTNKTGGDRTPSRPGGQESPGPRARSGASAPHRRIASPSLNARLDGPPGVTNTPGNATGCQV